MQMVSMMTMMTTTAQQISRILLQNPGQAHHGMIIEPTSTHPPSQLTNSILSPNHSVTNGASNDVMDDTMRDSSSSQNQSSLRAQVVRDKASNSSSQRDDIDLLAARREVKKDSEILVADMKRSSDSIEQDDNTVALKTISKRIETRSQTVNDDHTMNDSTQQATPEDDEDEQSRNSYHMDDDLSGANPDENDDDAPLEDVLLEDDVDAHGIGASGLYHPSEPPGPPDPDQ